MRLVSIIVGSARSPLSAPSGQEAALVQCGFPGVTSPTFFTETLYHWRAYALVIRYSCPSACTFSKLQQFDWTG